MIFSSPLAPIAHAQVTCPGAALGPPLQLLERFIPADCSACWQDTATPTPDAQTLVLDWIVPLEAAPDAALSAAARRDALERLTTLGLPLPLAQPHTTTPRTQVHRSAPSADAQIQLGVALGPAVNDYIGVALRLSDSGPASPSSGASTAAAPSSGAQAAGYAPIEPVKRRWPVGVVLFEVLPAGTEGSPVARHLVRNALTTEIESSGAGAAADPTLRVLQLPEGTRPERLAAVAWTLDAHGQLLSLARTPTCATD
ncbi:MAG: hypothetical protein Fur007_08960 [Rhodoferax sp.]